MVCKIHRQLVDLELYKKSNWTEVREQASEQLASTIHRFVSAQSSEGGRISYD